MAAYFLDLLTLWALFAAAATVVAALAEDAGFMNVGAASFMAIGAYACAILTTGRGVQPAAALAAATLTGAVAGAAVHLILGRLRGDVLALGTLAIGVVVHGLILNASDVTGGPMGIAGVPRWEPLLGHIAADSLAFLAAILTGVAAVRSSRYASRIHALRDDEVLASELGLRVGRVRLTLWVVSSAALAMVGGLYAFHLRYVDPSSFTVRESVSVLAMALILPRPKLISASIGALVFIALPEGLRFVGLPVSAGAEVRQILFALALLVMVGRGGSLAWGVTRHGGSRA